MRYLLMIYSDETRDAEKPQSDIDREIAAYFAYNASAKAAGVYRDGAGLHPTSAATTVRVRDGGTLTTDGPFAETKEQFGGYYLLDCKDLDEAIEWASRIPHASQGCVEIRPVMDYSKRAPA